MLNMLTIANLTVEKNTEQQQKSSHHAQYINLCMISTKYI